MTSEALRRGLELLEVKYDTLEQQMTLENKVIDSTRLEPIRSPVLVCSLHNFDYIKPIGEAAPAKANAFVRGEKFFVLGHSFFPVQYYKLKE